MTEAEAIDLLMERKGAVLAAIAWGGFLLVGRGYVLTDGDSVGYVPACMAARLPRVLRCPVRRLVRLYRPEKELVLLLATFVGRTIVVALGKRAPVLPPQGCFHTLGGTPGCPPLQAVPWPGSADDTGTT